MSNCCSPKGYRWVFSERSAQAEARRYRRRGLDATSRRIVDFLRTQGVEGSTVLEVGGGIGGIQIELLKAGAARAVSIELTPTYEDAASDLLNEAGLTDRVERRVMDFAQAASQVESADVVIMNRVICCYPAAAGGCRGRSCTAAARPELPEADLVDADRAHAGQLAAVDDAARVPHLPPPAPTNPGDVRAARSEADRRPARHALDNGRPAQDGLAPDRQTKRLMKVSAVSATSRHPLSMVSACPRPAISVNSVTPGFRFWRL